MEKGFLARELSILAYSNGFTLWHYRTEDSEVAVLSEQNANPELTGYFAPACDLVRRGDQLIVSLECGMEPRILNLVVTESAPCGYVTVRSIAAPALAPAPSVGGGEVATAAFA